MDQTALWPLEKAVDSGRRGGGRRDRYHISPPVICPPYGGSYSDIMGGGIHKAGLHDGDRAVPSPPLWLLLVLL